MNYVHPVICTFTSVNGDLDEDIYMEQPEGCVDGANPEFVCKLLEHLFSSAAVFPPCD